MKPFLVLLILCFLVLSPRLSFAVDETASDLVAFGAINLTQMTDTLNQKYPATRKAFWNVSGIAYHDFTGGKKTDVLIGLSGYQDKGLVYNGDKQLVEDTGSGFAYFHKIQDQWKLMQVELVEGKHYVGFEGANLMGGETDQLVVYSSNGVTQIANIYNLQSDGQFHSVTRIASTGMGPRVLTREGKQTMVNYERALINRCDDCAIYYGRPYQWDGTKFTEGKDEYLDQMASYDPVRATDAQAAKMLAFFENYLKVHPDNFGATANSYDLSARLGLKKEAQDFKGQMEDWGDKEPACPHCDEWLAGRNKVYQEQYMDQVEGKPKVSKKLDQQ
jgi:hypothetical protein